MSHEAKIHPIQTLILRELLFKPEAGFAELQKICGVDSDHFKFHIARLVDIGYLMKTETKKYKLTPSGKEYANKLDTDSNTIERQPKAAVIVVLQNDKKEVLVQERLKQPYYGFWGYPGGKIRWGETILQTAERELLEETGLTAEVQYKGVYHEIVKSAETGEILEDKIFHVINASNPIGTMIAEFEGGRNAWMSMDNLSVTKKKYGSTDIESAVGLGELQFFEQEQVYSEDEF